ncbi:serine hydrolase domain-containing protein [Phytomonospora endophytica]|uniref:D-alanyl-D-alanine carboxypeptidase n=1 Tax=Phytomonospora endophytica TaxID=714109 RepID=A0A841FJQ9_9ACTN|nr:serine hydrolase domain-containing protein [Phytomonospora endophytica]MBB6036114.1 D-alanyl-D-alanine carboxypeptidase [Phytomonospora endophytica]
MKKTTRAVLTAAFAATVLSGLAAPAAAEPVVLPPVNKTGLAAAIAGLPADGTTAALVRVTDVDPAQDWAGASGVRDRRSGAPAEVDARVRIGSVSKVFNTAIVLQLVDEGLVDLDESVQHYLPRLLPADYPPITVGQLLNFTSGLPSMSIPGSDEFAWQYEHRFDHWTPERYVRESLRGKKMLFAPGTKQQYVNINTVLSGLVIERVTGSTWEKQLRERITKPLGLKDTYAPGNATGIKGEHQRGYQLVVAADGTRRFVDVTRWNVSDRFASGDMISTTADLTRFTKALFAGEVVPDPVLENMFTVPEVPVYDGNDDPADDEAATRSMGLQRNVLPGGIEVWGKTGARPGYLNGIGALRDGSRILVYSLGATDAKSEDQHPLMMPIIGAAMGL